MSVDKTSDFNDNMDLSQEQSNTRAKKEQEGPCDTKTPLQHDTAIQIIDDNKELAIHSNHKENRVMTEVSNDVPLQQQSPPTFNPKILQRSGAYNLLQTYSSSYNTVNDWIIEGDNSFYL